MTPHSDHEALKIIVSDSSKLRNQIEISPLSARQYQPCVNDVFGSAADKTMQMNAAIFRLLDPFVGSLFLAAVNICHLACAGWSSALEQRQVMNMTEHQRIHTILQSATARWALRVLSVLSLLCGSR